MKNSRTEKVFLTVGTQKQKLLSENLISHIDSELNVDIIVVSDEEHGGRIGSGGALLNILGSCYDSSDKMLVINCGGLSKRSINYAIRGKVFADTMYNGKVITLLELILKNAGRLMDSFSSGVLVCCSDILIDTTDVKTDFDNNIGFCVRTDFETGARHGVMFPDGKNILMEYPHKYPVSVLKAKSEKYGTDGVFVDTGVTYLADEVCTVLKNAVIKNDIINGLISNKVELNLYPEIIALFAERCDKNEYLHTDVQNCYHAEIRNLLFSLLSGFSLKVCILEGQSFAHFGSLNESLRNILAMSKTPDGYLKLNSYTDNNSVIGQNTVLDNVVFENGCIVGNNCIVSDITLDSAVIKDNSAVCGIKLCDGSYVAVVCDINENPKDIFNSQSLWEIPRFYKGLSFSDSFSKFTNNRSETRYSLAYCTENADYDYYFIRSQYLDDMQSYTVKDEYIAVRNEIIGNYFIGRKPLQYINCKKNRVCMDLPVRVNLSGTWTDAMPYCIKNGGQVINMAVTVDGKKPITVIAEKLSDKKIEFCNDGITTAFNFDSYDTSEDLSDFNLHTAVLKTLGITKETVIDDGFRLSTYVSGIDKGSGLGTSSILLGGCIKVLAELFDIRFSDAEVFKMVFVAEQIMKTGGGWQDQVGGLLPSLKVSTTEPGIEQVPTVEYISIPEKFKEFFSQRLVLIPTGRRHFGRFIVNDVANKVFDKNEDAVSALTEMKELNCEIIDSFRQQNIEKFLFCVNKHFALLKRISPLVSDERIDMLAKACLEDVADAVSICGAGGGGYFLAVLKKDVTVEQLQKYINTKFTDVTGAVKKIQISEN